MTEVPEIRPPRTGGFGTVLVFAVQGRGQQGLRKGRGRGRPMTTNFIFLGIRGRARLGRESGG